MFTWKKYVCEIYKEKSFSKAAHNLYISQPSLSARIKRIEQKLGVPLFDRSTSPLRLTDIGEAYVEAADKITQIEQDFENYINSLNALKTGRLSVGASNLFAAYVLPPLINQFKNKFPDISIHLTEGNTEQLETMLSNNTLDFVIDNYHYDRNLYSKELYCHENILLSVPKQFPINESLASYQLSHEDIKRKNYLNAECKSVPLHAFKDVPFIMLKSGNDTRIRGDKLCFRSDFHPKIIIELDQQATAYMASSTQLGATFISDILVAQLPSFENLVYYKLDGDAAKRDVYFYYKKNRYKTSIMNEFIQLVHE